MGKFQLRMTTATELPSSSRNRSEGDRDVYSLSKVTQAVGKMLDERVGGKRFWVRAEISQCSISGKHAYLDLVEEREGQRLAQLRGTIWASRLEDIRTALGGEFDEVLKPGREIVFSAHMAFHAVYGFSLNIQEIDLDVLLGEMERRRKATLAMLTQEQAIGRNGQLPLARVPQRLVLIGSKGTAGFTDFMTHMDRNGYGYAFDLGVLDTPVQGASAPAALIAALHRAGRAAMRMGLDAVVLLRGGGAKLDLDVFNDLSLCRTIARMEVPVIVGIGHETDQTLVDVVAHTACKTPTAVADFLLERTADFESAVAREARGVTAEARAQLAERRAWIGKCTTLVKERPLSHIGSERGALYAAANAVVRRTRLLIADQNGALGKLRSIVSAVASNVHDSERRGLTELEHQIQREATRLLAQHEERMTNLKGTLALLGPENTLRRGFSITRKDGKAVRHAADLTKGDLITTQLSNGSVESVVHTTRLPSNTQPHE